MKETFNYLTGIAFVSLVFAVLIWSIYRFAVWIGNIELTPMTKEELAEKDYNACVWMQIRKERDTAVCKELLTATPFPTKEQINNYPQ